MARTIPLLIGMFICSLVIHATVISETKSSRMQIASPFQALSLTLYLYIYLASTSQSPSPPPPPSSNTVSWQSAFWALVALALNAMTQPSFLDCDSPFRGLSFARSSPIVCLTDALYTLFQLLLHTNAGVSVQDAAKRVVQERDIMVEPRLTLEKQYPLAHSVVFVLGVLPQAVKLFGMREIPWSHAWGAMYLSSFLVFAGVCALARYAGDDIDHPRATGVLDRQEALEKRNMMLLLVVVVVHIVMWVWCVLELFHSHWRISNNWENYPPPFYILLMLPGFAILLGIVVVMGPILLIAVPLSVTLFPPTILGKVVCFAVCILMVYLVVSHFLDFIELLLENDAVGFSVYLFFPALYLMKVVSAYYLWTFFAIANLVVPILYYRSQYDPTGTIEPLWTDKLG